MAGEVGHVVYGQRIVAYLGDSIGKVPEFWSGTLFPDIRHLGVVSRHHTHPSGVTLASLGGDSDFITGMRTHAWIDATREEFLRQQHIKEVLPWHPFVPHALKLLEDELLYDKYDDWDEIQHVLHKVRSDEVHFVEDKEAIESWHRTLRDYFAAPPTDETRLVLTERIGLSAAMGREFNSIISQLRKNTVARNLTEAFSLHLDGLLD